MITNRVNVLGKGELFASDTSKMTQPTIKLFPIQLTCTLGQRTEKKERPGPWGDGDRGDNSNDCGDD